MAHEAHPFEVCGGNRTFPSMSSKERDAHLPMAAKGWNSSLGPHWAGALYDQGSLDAIRCLLHPASTFAVLPCEPFGMIGELRGLGR